MKGKYRYVVILLTIMSMPVMIWSSGFLNWQHQEIKYEKAEILDVVSSDLQKDSKIPDLAVGTQQLKVKIKTGAYAGEIFHIPNPITRLYNVVGEVNQRIIVRMVMDGSSIQNITVFNYSRGPVLVGLVVIFLLAIVICGRKKGLMAVLSLCFTAVSIGFYLLPQIFKGGNPIVHSILMISVITVVNLLLVSDWSAKTMAAIAGTITGVLISGSIAYLAGKLVHLSGFTMDEAEELIYLAGDLGIRAKGLMFSAILIASLGAVMDVAMSIASAVFEFLAINPKMTRKDLWNSGMNVGRDVMGTMSNTLILAFAGGSLNIMILIVAYQMSARQIINLDVIGTEMILGLSGSIGVILTVPVTAFMAAVIAKKSHNK